MSQFYIYLLYLLQPLPFMNFDCCPYITNVPHILDKIVSILLLVVIEIKSFYSSNMSNY